MALRIYDNKNGTPWVYLRGRLNGRDVEEKTPYAKGTPKRTLETYRIKREADLLEALTAPATPADKTFLEAVLVYQRMRPGANASYIGLPLPDGTYSGLLGEFWDKRLREIDHNSVMGYVVRTFPTAKSATINRQVIVPMKAIFKANKVELDIERLKEEKPETRYATPSEHQAAMTAYSDLPHLRMLILCMTLTGRRISELVRVDRDKANLDGGGLYLGISKNGKPVTVKLPIEVLEELKQLPRFKNGRLFGYTRRNSVYEVMKRRCADAKIPYIPPHQIGRHTFAMWSLLNGMNPKRVQAAGGWDSWAAFERYLHLIPSEEQVAALEVVSSVLKSPIAESKL